MTIGPTAGAMKAAKLLWNTQSGRDFGEEAVNFMAKVIDRETGAKEMLNALEDVLAYACLRPSDYAGCAEAVVKHAEAVTAKFK